jgi:hypothetical protein
MSIKKQEQNLANLKHKSGWDMAIADAKERIKRLRYSIRVFEARKKAGDPWPDFLCRKLSYCAEEEKCAKPVGVVTIVCFL